MSEDHLMDKESFLAFTTEMMDQLFKHKEEKTPLKQKDPGEIFTIVVNQLEGRLAQIKNYGPEVMEKQSVHMANYLYFLWQTARKVQK